LQQPPSAQPGHGQQEQQPSLEVLVSAALIEAIGEIENNAAAKSVISFNIDTSFLRVLRIKTGHRPEAGSINS